MNINPRFFDGSQHMTTKGEIKVLKHYYVNEIPYLTVLYINTNEIIDKKYSDIYKNVYYYERKINGRLPQRTTTMSSTLRELTLKRNLKFGIELEVLVPSRNLLISKLKEKGIEVTTPSNTHTVMRNAWKVVRDGSLRSRENYEACEIVSPPSTGFEEIKIVCDVLKEIKAKVNSSCGFHVHHDIKELKRKQIMRIYNFYNKYETYINLFHTKQRDENRYCKSVSHIIDIVNQCETKSQLLSRIAGDGYSGYYNNVRYYKINLRSFIYYGTIEFRQHGGTIKYEDIHAWVLFTHKIIERALEINNDIQPTTQEQKQQWVRNSKLAYDSMFDEIHIKNTEISKQLLSKRRVKSLLTATA